MAISVEGVAATKDYIPDLEGAGKPMFGFGSVTLALGVIIRQLGSRHCDRLHRRAWRPDDRRDLALLSMAASLATAGQARQVAHLKALQ
ncbi:hypothetical protein [Mesorhizobium kowhaii]|uniref:Uncharacterized protein n=1 Tax=Mesorhizobium kowhaii TaxID=1300272 RepID=A0A2W7C0L0_9HYPH|nr:hypothetical protein [Mesorhizobium kowhaii]PZV36630.1 hypothetical protein B5V02_20690 [Mesorhizobium kowhaii]